MYSMMNSVGSLRPRVKLESLASAQKQKDEKNYLDAVKEYGETADEIEKINATTGPESEAGEQTSKQVAATISGLIMTLIIIIMLIP